jgi:outer membrane receptor protein involved in Fe transport
MIDQPPEIVITARPLPPGRGEAAQGVVVIGPEELERAASQGLDQIVRQVPGVQLFRRSDARSANPTSQGVTLRGLGGNAASRALVLLDGVPQNDPFGGWINWPALDPAGLAEVRVTRGGGSVLFGPGALAGVIELTSDRSEGVRAALDGGLHGAGKARLALNRGGASFAAFGGADEGFVPIVREDRGAADRKAPFSFGGVRASLRSRQFEVGALLFADRRERGLAKTDNQSRGADLFLRWRSEGRASVTLSHQERRFESAFASASAGRAVVTPTLSQAVPARASGWSAEVRPVLGALELRLGSDGRLAEGRSEELASFVAGAPTRGREASGRQATAGLFADLAGDVAGLMLSGGVRVDRWWLSDLSLEERSLATGTLLFQDRAADRKGWAPTARAGVRRQVTPALAVRGAAYLGWRLPTLNELVRPFRVGRDAVAANAALEPERLRGVEAGLDWSEGPWRGSATLFTNRLSNPVVNVTRGIGPGSFPGVGFVAGTYRRRENLEAIDSRGVEVELGWRRGDWRASGAVSLVSAKVRDAGPLDGLRPAQVPSLTATAEVGWRTFGLQLRHVGGQAEDDTGEIRLPAATTLDASAAWPLGRGVELRLRGENLLNARVIAARSADGVDERATPRRLWVGLRLTR